MFALIKICWLQLRYGLESGADISCGLAGAVGSARIRGAEWKDAKAVSGHYGKTVADARLNALRFWVRKHGDTKSKMPVFRLDTKRFSSPASIRLWCWGMVLRLALLVGHPVVLIGACRTGKTLLLSKLTPGKIIDKREDAMRGQRPAISEADVPAGIYSLDECQLIEPASIGKLVSAMVAQKRTFCLSAQHYRSVEEAVDSYRSTKGAKRVVLVVVGGQSNPPVILRELPQ